FRRKSHESEALGHFAVYDIAFLPAWAIFPLTLQSVEIVATVRNRTALHAFGIFPGNSPCHQRTNGALRLALGCFPIKTIVLSFITEDPLCILVVLGVVFLLRRHQFLANVNGRYFIPANSP